MSPSASRGTSLGHLLRRFAPFLFKKCPAGLSHAFYDQVCYCRLHEHVVGGKDDWHGGIYDFRSKREIKT